LKLIRDQVIVLGLTLLDFVSRFHLPTHSIFRARAVLSVLALTLACAPGCKRIPADITTPATKRMAAALALIPADTGIVVGLDLERLRGHPAWLAALSALTKNESHFLDGFAAGTGLDLPRQVRRVLIALPEERQGDDRFALIADADALDEARVTAWLRARLGERTTVFVRAKNQIVISQGDWSGKIATLASATKLTPSAADHKELLRLCTRASLDHDLWFAALAPSSVRHDLMQQADLADVAAIARASGFIDLTAGARGGVVAELSSTTDAIELAHRLGVYLNRAKRHPETLVRGLAPYLEVVRLEASNARVQATFDIPGAEVGDLIERIEALAHGSGTQ
jgi:hypothetical protein